MPKKKKGQSQVCVYQDWCKGCGLCVAFCPAKVLELNALGKAVPVRESDCINCGFCELHCPDFAISIRPVGAPNSAPDPTLGTTAEDGAGNDMGPERSPNGEVC